MMLLALISHIRHELVVNVVNFILGIHIRQRNSWRMWVISFLVSTFAIFSVFNMFIVVFLKLHQNRDGVHQNGFSAAIFVESTNQNTQSSTMNPEH